MAATQTCRSRRRNLRSGARTIDGCARPCIATRLTTRQGLQERLFTLAFSGLVYPQIWEDPGRRSRRARPQGGRASVAIASGGCNVLSYLATVPVTITAVDLNPAHVALNKLKLAALDAPARLRRLPPLLRRGRRARTTSTPTSRTCSQHLDENDGDYWDSRDRLGRRRIGYFASNLYRHGLLGAFIGAGHLLARAAWRQPAPSCSPPRPSARAARASSSASWRRCSTSGTYAGCSTGRPSLFGLGIPPSQFAALKGQRDEHGGCAARAPRAPRLRLRLSPTITSPGRHSAAATRPAAIGAAAALPAARAAYDALRARAG